jgi:hypothetical protein
MSRIATDCEFGVALPLTVIMWAVEAIFVETTPVIVLWIAAAVVKQAGRILTYTAVLITSLTNLTSAAPS